jgi:hypothetical protein
MKRIGLLQIVAFCMTMLMIVSCSTTKTVSIHATPGTKISTPNYSQSVTVPNSGCVDFPISYDNYYGYFLAKSSNQDVAIPFGIDTKFKSYTGIGLVGVLGIPFLVIPTYIVWDRMNSLGASMQFTYREDQSALDMGTAPLISRDPKKSELVAASSKQSAQRQKATSSTTQESGQISIGEGSTARTRSDYAKNIQGTYIGSGALLKSNTLQENYTDVKLVLERIDKSHVKVIYYESGEEYFAAPDTYEVTRNSDGIYSLVITNIPSATITIDKNGNLTYLHKKVLIDGDTYTLKASAVSRKQ